jgi:hypothetical protein
VRLVSQSTVKLLVEGVDYFLVLPYEAATRSIGIPVYGGISLNNSLTNGIISLDYQTIGGDWVSDRDQSLTVIYEKMYNPRTTYWDVVTSKPYEFPPINHDLEIKDTFGQDELIQAVNNIAESLLDGSKSLTIVTHISDLENPHNVTKEQLGIGNVENCGVATSTEVSEGTSTNTLVTPATLTVKLAQYFDNNISELLGSTDKSFKDYADSTKEAFIQDVMVLFSDAVDTVVQRFLMDLGQHRQETVDQLMTLSDRISKLEP